MTYDQIAEWVIENFDVETYGTPEDLIREVELRFNQDGMYFPPEAKENLNNVWQAQVGIPRQESIEDAMQRRYEEAMQELDQKVQAFFASVPEMEYYEPEVPYTEAVEEPSIPTEVQPQRPRSRIRSLGQRVRRFFRFRKK